MTFSKFPLIPDNLWIYFLPEANNIAVFFHLCMNFNLSNILPMYKDFKFVRGAYNTLIVIPAEG